jgi:hypothetical protein
MSGILTWFPFNPAEAGTYAGANIGKLPISSISFLLAHILARLLLTIICHFLTTLAQHLPTKKPERKWRSGNVIIVLYLRFYKFHMRFKFHLITHHYATSFCNRTPVQSVVLPVHFASHRKSYSGIAPWV